MKDTAKKALARIAESPEELFRYFAEFDEECSCHFHKCHDKACFFSCTCK